MDEPAKVSKACSYDESWFYSRWFFAYLIPLFQTGNQRPLDFGDIPSCIKVDNPIPLTAKLESEWMKELDLFRAGKKKRPSMMKAVVRTFGWEWFYYAQLALWPEIIVRLAQPFMIRIIVVYLTQEDDSAPESISHETALITAYILFISVAVWSITRHHAFLLVCRTGINIRTALTALIFKKVLRVSKSSFAQTDIGQILNVLANDLYRFEDILGNLWSLIIGPAICILGVYFVWNQIGIAALGGIIILLLFVPFQATMGSLFNKYRRQTTHITDKRVRLMSEIISAMKLIKVYCWETPFAESVDKIRQTEIVSIYKTYILRGINGATSFVGTRIMLFSSFIIYSLMGNPLTPDVVFVVMALFNALRVPVMNQFTAAVAVGGECFVAERRVVDLLLLEEKPEKARTQQDKDTFDKNIPKACEGNSKGGISLKSYVGKWNMSLPVNNLDDITLDIEPGQLVVVVGSVGSGKTCFLWSLLNEIEQVSGSMKVDGKLSYAPQESWSFGGTLKQNILIGSDFHAEKYHEVIQVTGLERDVNLFSDGHDTYIGERGYTLSGGQKARVTLARSVYVNADIYLLDDPLSAVDPKVANDIFDKCIKNYLKGKTVVLVTHQLQFLPQADKILVLDNGKCVAMGSYQELKDSSVEFLQFLDKKKREEDNRRMRESESCKRDRKSASIRTLRALSHTSVGSRKSSLTSENNPEETTNQWDWMQEEEEEGIADAIPRKESAPEPTVQDKNKSVNPKDRSEQKGSGSVSLSVYWEYLTAGGSMWLIWTAVIIALLSQTVYHYTDLWLSAWTEHTIKDKVGSSASTVSTDMIFDDETHNVILYSILVVALFIGAFIRTYLTFQLCLKCSICLHDRIFKRVLRAPMLFFESTPIGQILNRFTRDVGVVDQIIPSSLIDLNISVLNSLGVVIMSCVVSPWLCIPCAIMAILCVPVRNYYIKTGRELQRLDSIARSPIYTHTSCTFDGLITVRAFKLENLFQRQYFRYLTDSVACRFIVMAGGRLIGMILDLFVSVYIACICLLLVYLPKGTISGGDAGVILSGSILMTGMFQWAVRLTAELETQMVSAERIFEYGRLKEEAALKVPGSTGADKDWPSEGAIEFNDVSLKYEPDLPFVLKHVTFRINPGEHIGVVGRTGAGKSTLISVLFRLVEPTTGVITIDGIKTSNLGLHDLRQKMSIIPQDPSLFSGSIRRNLDPFNEYKDKRLWDSLKEANLSTAIESMQGSLDGTVSEGGSNLSLGQRQLLCLARSLLKSNKILVLDEATANVDQETDAMIQATIKGKFASYTIITVAHRLNTIIDMDKVLVMDAGEVVEFGEPYILLRNQGGMFHSIVKQTGPQYEKMLHKLAERSYFDRVKRKKTQEPDTKTLTDCQKDIDINMD